MKKLIILIALLLAISSTQKTFAAEQPSVSATLTSPKTESKDSIARIVALENTFKKYDSKLLPYAPVYISMADKYGVDWKLLPSIAGLESTFGAHMIDDTYNAYGWGSGTIPFKSWEDGIEIINKALRENYMDKWKAKTVWEIGPIYAESPTWSVRVNHFMEEIDKEYEKVLGQQKAMSL